MYACTGILPLSCISSLGPIGCFYKMMADKAPQDSQAPNAAQAPQSDQDLRAAQAPPPVEEPAPSKHAVLGPALGGALAGKAMSYDPAAAGDGRSERVWVSTHVPVMQYNAVQ
jgi:hypothetical protein